MRPRIRGRTGMIYLEVVVASLVFALTLAGLGASIVAQEKLMRAIEQRAYVIAPIDRQVGLVLVDGDQPGGFWPVARLVASPASRSGLDSIEGAAFRHVATDPSPVPRLLCAVDRRPDHWPPAGRTIEPVALDTHLMGNDGTVPTFELNHVLTVVVPREDAGSPAVSTLTVDLVPNLPE